MTEDPRNAYLVRTLNLRLVVGYLGERSQYGWWATTFFDASSRAFLEPVFVKTSRLAKYHGVVEAARQLHDSHLSVGAYHLFRLPEELEQDLHVFMRDSDQVLPLLEVLTDKVAGLSTLEALAVKAEPLREGPIALGKSQDIGAVDMAERMAAAYLPAFRKDARCYPYLTN